MASTELIVAFSAQVEGLTTSLKRVNSSLEELRANAVTAGNAIESNVSGLSRAFSSLGNSIKGAVLAYAGFAGVRALGEVAVSVDDLNSSLRRLQILTGQSAGSIQSLFANLNQIGAQTGASVQSLTDQFQRFYVATTAIGASSSQVQQLVTVLAQFGRLSSGGPQEAAAAITQLSQGLASGRLNGDELKSVLENMPQLAQALATALGVGVGELRKMGEEGKLTADVVFPALLRAGEGLTRQLAGLPLTLRQSFQVAMDGMTRAAQEADKAIGATEFLSRVFQWIGQGGQAAARRIGGGAPGIEAQQVAESEIARLRENLRLQEQIRDAELQRRANMPADQANRSVNQERYRQVTQNVLTAQQQFEEASSGAVDRVLQNVGVIVNADNDALERRLNGMRESARQTDQILTTIERRNNERLRISGKADEDRAAVRARMNSDMTDSERARAERAIAMITAEEQKDLAAIATREGAAAAALNRRTQREDDAQKLADDRRAQAAREAFLRVSGGPVEDFEKRLRDQLAGAQALFAQSGGGNTPENRGRVVEFLGEQTANLAEQLSRVGRNGAEAGDALTRSFGDWQKILEAAGVDVAQIEAILAAARERAATQTAQASAKTSFALSVAQKGIQDFSKSAADSIVEFAATGEMAFAEMTLSILKNIAKMILEFLIMEAIFQGIQASTGINLRPAGRRAAGGPISPGQTYLVGENGPELFTSTGAGHIFPNVPGGSGGTTVNVYNQATGTTTRQQERTNGLGGKEIDIYIEQVVQRGMTNGKFDNALGTSFGASRVGRV